MNKIYLFLCELLMIVLYSDGAVNCANCIRCQKTYWMYYQIPLFFIVSMCREVTVDEAEALSIQSKS